MVTRRGFAIAAQSRARLEQTHPIPLKKAAQGLFSFRITPSRVQIPLKNAR